MKADMTKLRVESHRDFLFITNFIHRFYIEIDGNEYRNESTPGSIRQTENPQPMDVFGLGNHTKFYTTDKETGNRSWIRLSKTGKVTPLKG